MLAFDQNDGMTYLLKLQYRTFESIERKSFNFTLISISPPVPRASEQLPPYVAYCVIHGRKEIKEENLPSLKAELQKKMQNVQEDNPEFDFTDLMDDLSTATISSTPGKYFGILSPNEMPEKNWTKEILHEETTYLKSLSKSTDVIKIEVPPSAISSGLKTVERKAVENLIHHRYGKGYKPCVFTYTQAWARIIAMQSPHSQTLTQTQLPGFLAAFQTLADRNKTLRSREAINDWINERVVEQLKSKLEIIISGQYYQTNVLS